MLHIKSGQTAAHEQKRLPISVEPARGVSKGLGYPVHSEELGLASTCSRLSRSSNFGRTPSSSARPWVEVGTGEVVETGRLLGELLVLVVGVVPGRLVELV